MGGKQTRMFGGDWTERKLDALRQYLSRYVMALKKQPFRLVYIDAFAGTGYREERETASVESLLFPDFAEEEPRGLLDGSATLALKVDPPFHEYVFIERSRRRCAELQGLRDQFPALADRITVIRGDCNVELPDFCRRSSWHGCRAVLFLDPFAMQVEWATLEAVAATRAIDTWILWPLMAMNRLLQRGGEIPESWRLRLDRFLGADDWFARFYRVERASDLFGQDIEKIRKVADFRALSAYLNERLRGVFAGVAENPAILSNTAGAPLFLFCFAAANAKGAPIAKRISEHILRGL